MPMTKKDKGFSLVEVVVTVSIFLVIIVGLTGGFALAVKSALENVTKIQASLLEEEGLEAMRLLRDSSWTNNIVGQPVGIPFYLVFNGTAWEVSATPAMIDGLFERRIILSEVYRDPAQNIAPSGTLDPAMRKVTAQVSWRSRGATTTRSLSTYLADIFEN